MPRQLLGLQPQLSNIRLDLASSYEIWCRKIGHSEHEIQTQYSTSHPPIKARHFTGAHCYCIIILKNIPHTLSHQHQTHAFLSPRTHPEVITSIELMIVIYWRVSRFVGLWFLGFLLCLFDFLFLPFVPSVFFACCAFACDLLTVFAFAFFACLLVGSHSKGEKVLSFVLAAFSYYAESQTVTGQDQESVLPLLK